MLPFIHLTSQVSIPTYFLMISLGFVFGVFLLLYWTNKKNLSTAFALDLSLCVMLGSFLGSRLFHILYEEPLYYHDTPWAIFWIWQGGFVFYGGLIGALSLSFLLFRLRREPPLIWLDTLSLVFPFVYAWGRLGTLFSGSGYGRPTDLPWAITYPPGSEAPANIALHPTPLYAMAWNLFWGLVLLYLHAHRKNWSRIKNDGQIFYLTCMGYSLGRFWIEQLRDDPRGQMPLGLTISSWISLFIFFAATLFLWRRSQTS